LALIPDLLGFPMQSRMWTLNRLGYRYIPCDLFGAHTPKLGARALTKPVLVLGLVFELRHRYHSSKLMKKRVLVIAVRCEQSASSCSRIHHAHLCIDARSDGEALLQRELRLRTSRFRRLRNRQQVHGGGLVMGPWADLMGPWADQIDILIYLIFRRVQQHHVPPDFCNASESCNRVVGAACATICFGNLKRTGKRHRGEPGLTRDSRACRYCSGGEPGHTWDTHGSCTICLRCVYSSKRGSRGRSKC